MKRVGDKKAMCPTHGLVIPVQNGDKYQFIREPTWWPVGRCPECDSRVWSREPEEFGIEIERVHGNQPGKARV